MCDIMGGMINVTVAGLAAIAFFVDGSIVMAIVACLVGSICCASWLHMWYFAKQLARQRLYVAALDRGEITEGTPEAENLWCNMPVSISSKDVQDVPDWITKVNMVASLLALALLLWGGLAVLL